MEFKERLRRARKDKGITQQDLATRAGVTVSAIQRAEYGPHVPSAALVAKLAAELGVSLDDLFAPNGEEAA